ncbi:formylglycine-generating enzyme family protein [Candidatus Nitrospira salsa]
MTNLPTSVTTALLASTFLLNPLGIAFAEDTKNMAHIPRGEFTMGSNEHGDEKPHQVVLDAYHIDKFEVSNKDYKEFLKDTGHTSPAYWDDPRLSGTDQPVVGVNWYDASKFCEWKGKRLPTEAEWERAAKGKQGSHYPWGHELSKEKANYGQNVGKTTAVNSYPEGVSEYGLYNMAGNVFEWVSDWYDPKYYDDSPAMNPQGPATGINFANQGAVKVLKGGSWLAPSTSLHTSHRFWNQPENNSYGVGLGFRCAKSESREMAKNVQYDFMHALISMGKEEWKDALTSIDKALEGDKENIEYQQTRDIIMKQMNK